MAGPHSYRIVREENSTALGEVYEATHPQLPGRFLIEVLDGVAHEESALDAFEREVTAVASLGHPHLLELHELGASPDGTPVLIHKLPDGMSLSRWLEEGQVARPDEAVALIAGLADALDAAHDRGLAHGSLRAEYIYLAREEGSTLGSPRLRGFGQRWLDVHASAASARRRSNLTAADVAEDVHALAALAELLLTAPERRGLGLANDAEPTRLIHAVLNGDEHPRSAGAFATELGQAFSGPGALVRPVRFLTVAAGRGGQGARLALGLASGVGLALVIVLVALIPISLKRRADQPARVDPVAQGERPSSAELRPRSLFNAGPAAARPTAVDVGPAPRASLVDVGPTAHRPSVVNVGPAPHRTSLAQAGPAPRQGHAPASDRGHLVWSDSLQKLIKVDDRGQPIEPAARPSAPADPRPAAAPASVSPPASDAAPIAPPRFQP
jgi:hypothetical protein